MTGSRRRWLRLVGFAATAAMGWAGIGVALAGTAAPAAASRVGKPVTAWWSAANPGHGLPSLPPPPDVKGHRLLVQGSNAATVSGPESTAPATAQAVAALRWTLPAHLLPTSLDLRIAGTPPPAVSVQACRITAPFRPAYGGEWSAVPAHSCAHPVDASLQGRRLVFSRLTPLRRGSVLALLLVPGPLDRVVLTGASGAQLHTRWAAASAHRRTPAPAQRSRPGTGGNAGTRTGRPGSPSTNGATPATGTIGPGTTVPAVKRVIRQPPAASGRQPEIAEPGSSTSPDSIRAPQVAAVAGWRRLVAGGIIALEVAAFALLRRRGDREPGQPARRGVGRFVRERDREPLPL